MLTDYLPQILLALSIQTVGVLSPGPGVMLVIRTALADGRLASLVTALGISTASAILASTTVLGLAALIALNPHFLFLIKIISAAYLLFLAYKAFRASRQAISFDMPGVAAKPESSDLWWYWARGCLLQFTNPKAIFVWITIIGAGGAGDAPAPIVVLFIFAAMTNSFLGHGLYGFLLSYPTMREGYKRYKFWLEIAFGCFFVFAAYKMLMWTVAPTA